MGLDRTPPVSDHEEDRNEQGLTAKFIPPSGKLAAVTRKGNEIGDLMNTGIVDKELLKAQNDIYMEKIEVLKNSCFEQLLTDITEKGKRDEWWRQHYTDFVNLRVQFEKYYQSLDGAISKNPLPSLSGITRSSRSTGSNVSSARVRLAEKKAKLAAEKDYNVNLFNLEKEELEDKKKLEEKELERRNKLRELKTRSAEVEHRVLENELSKLDDIADLIENPSLLPNTVFDGNKTEMPAMNDNNFTNYGNNKLLEVLTKQNDISIKIAGHQERAELPRKQVPIFNGEDLTEYRPFMQNFTRTISDKCDNPADRLYYLEQYTTGDPKEIVKSCNHRNPAVAYTQALKLLEDEYGNEHKTATAFLQKLEDWPNIKSEDGEGLKQLSVYLLTCSNNMGNMSTMTRLNSPKEIMSVIRKLPFELRKRWRNETSKLLDANIPVTFADLVKFVRSQSKIMNQPLFGDIKDAPYTRTNPSTNLKKKGLTTKATEKTQSKYISDTPNSAVTTGKYCYLCKKDNHDLSYCHFFKEKDHDSKIEFIKKLGLCFGCLKQGHMSSGCSKRLTCTVCQKKHPTLLHNDRIKSIIVEKKEPISKNEDNEEKKEENEDEAKSEATVKAFALQSGIKTGAGDTHAKKYLCSVIPIKIKLNGQKTFVQLYAVLDACSEACFIDANLLQKLGASPKTSTVKIDSVGNINKEVRTRVLNNLEIYDINEQLKDVFPVTFAQEQWPFRNEDSPRQEDLPDHLSSIPFEFIEENVGMIIGMNRSELIKPYKIIDGPKNSMYASLHKLGWALNGLVRRSTKNNVTVHRIALSNIQDIENKIEKMYQEDYKDSHIDKKEMSEDELKWKVIMDNSVKLDLDNHYVIDLPLKDDVTLPNNRVQASRIFDHLLRKFECNNDLFQDYNKFMMMMLQNGYMEKVPDEELNKEAWYLTHHSVYHKQKNKIRVVYNCSLKYKGVSLNDSLYQGPDLNNSLIGVLLRFRQEPIAFMGDIEKMFYQVRVSPEHRDHLRFLWLDPSTKKTSEFRLTVHVFGATSSPSVANYALKRTTIDNNNYSETTKTAVQRSFYVDDLLCSTETNEEAANLLTEVKDIVSHGGFNLTSIVSNSDIMMKLFADNNIACELVSKEIPSNSDNFALGLIWDVTRDKLKIKLNFQEKPPTRRGILSTIHSIYDPLGLCGPAILPAKKIFQDSCRRKLPWDEILPPDLHQRWLRWREDLTILSDYEINRACKPEVAVSTQLHFFCDGSTDGYGSIAYVRFVLHNGEVHCSPIIAKSRLTPMTNTTLRTIPRIELNGAKLAVSLKQILYDELDYKIDEEFYWSDSTTIIHYLNNSEKQYSRFVANRIRYILSNSKKEQWRYVPGSLNPADHISRGVTINKFVTLKDWKNGPDFLWKTEENWPNQDVLKRPQAADLEETKSSKCLNAKINIEKRYPIDKIFDSTSSWYVMQRRVSWLLRFKSMLSGNTCSSGTLTVQELRTAEMAIIKYIQEQSFGTSMNILIAKNRLNRHDVLQKLDPFVDDFGILRVGGRLHHSSLDSDSRHPIILPNKNSNVEKLIVWTHKTLGHMGRDTLAAYLRRKFWIIGLNNAIRKLQYNCIICRKFNAQPQNQKMSSLPRDRVSVDKPAFTNTGLDYFGPYNVINGRKHEKRYGVIFTCLSSRAIHIEMAYSLSTDAFINAFRRFVARRGNVRVVRSDNGTNLVSGCRELKESLAAWNKSKIENWMIQHDLDWKFQPPSASHFGGVFEREIRSIKKVLNSILSEQPLKLSDEQLNTLFCEIESILNCRPLTELSSDKEDLNALTPNHLLLLHAGATYPPGLFSKDDTYVQRRWRQVQHLSEVFWTRFRKEYLPLLQKRTKWFNIQRNLRKDDLVLLTDQMLPRNQWSTGRVTEVFPDSKGLVRSVRLKVAKYTGKKTNKNSLSVVELVRPVSKLILISAADCN